MYRLRTSRREYKFWPNAVPLFKQRKVYSHSSVVIMVFSIYMNVHLLSAGLAPALRRSVVEQEQVEKKEKLAKSACGNS